MSNGSTGSPLKSWGTSEKSWFTSDSAAQIALNEVRSLRSTVDSMAHNPAPKSTRPKKPMSKEQITRAKWMLLIKKKRLHGALIDDTTLGKIFTNPGNFPPHLHPPKTISGLRPLRSKQGVGQALKRYQDHLASAKRGTKR